MRCTVFSFLMLMFNLARGGWVCDVLTDSEAGQEENAHTLTKKGKIKHELSDSDSVFITKYKCEKWSNSRLFWQWVFGIKYDTVATYCLSFRLYLIEWG